MAEARQAVGFRFSVTHDGGLNLDYDLEVLHVIWEATKRSWKKRFARFLNGLKTGLFPVRIEHLAGFVAILTAFHFAGVDLTHGLVKKFVVFCCTPETSIGHFISVVISSLLTALFFVVALRYSLRLLLSYQGWMFLPRTQQKNPPIHIKAWYAAVNVLCSIRKMGSGVGKDHQPLLYSYQGSMPALPLPSIDETIDRYLESVKSILTEKELSEMIEMAATFRTSIANRLQRYLYIKWLWSDNYVSDWWEEYVYLRGRTPIMINSNFYAVDAIFCHPTRVQSARAANVVHAAFTFRRKLLKQEFPPAMVQHVVPLCSRQYDRLFNTTRVPGEETDSLVHYSDSTHVAVMCHGKFYRLACYSKGRLLEPLELQAQVQGIIDDNTDPDKGEEFIGVLTASDRVTWAKARKRFFRRGTNKNSLNIIETAAFVLILDDYEYDFDPTDESGLSHFGQMMLHGKGYDRWFDKSFNIIVGRNGRIGGNVEHSWADAPISAHLWEFILIHDIKTLSYDPEGNCRGIPNEPYPQAMKLRWEIPEELRNTLNECVASAKLLCDDLDLHIIHFTDFGKSFATKTAGLSPDGFFQMALQLAYRRDSGGRSPLTYEACMTRLFKEGRTETVRPCTKLAVEWVVAMDNPESNNAERRALLKKTCERHVRLYQEAMTGKGVDRHLFCLYVVSKYLELESPFLQHVLSQPWKLSTSQTAVRGDLIDFKKHPELVSAGGGFGPVADDGYGVSYIIVGDNKVFFHVSSKRSSKETDSTRFANGIRQALMDIKGLYDE